MLELMASTDRRAPLLVTTSWSFKQIVGLLLLRHDAHTGQASHALQQHLV